MPQANNVLCCSFFFFFFFPLINHLINWIVCLVAVSFPNRRRRGKYLPNNGIVEKAKCVFVKDALLQCPRLGLS